MSEELETLSSTSAAPSWWTEMQRDYLAGMANVFILHGNVGDYVEHPTRNLTLREYLEQRLLRRHAVATFAPDQGITLAGGELVGRETRAWIDQTRGIEAPPSAAPGGFDAMAALRAQSGGGFGGGSDQEPLPSDAPNAIDCLLTWARESSPDDPARPARPTGERYVVGKDEDGADILARKSVPARPAIIIERADLIVPPSEKDRLAPADRALLAGLHRAGQDVGINRNMALVVILAPSLEEIHPDLRLSTAGIRTIEVSVPDHDQRLAFLARTLPARRAVLDGLSELELVGQTAGLGRRHIEDLAMRAAANGGLLTRAMVKTRKDELIKAEYGGILEVIEPTVGLDDVGGHDAVKAWLETWVLGPAASDDPDMREAFPSGLLLSGPSGTGKTMLARALAKALGWAFIFIRPENVKSMWVGESEKLWAKAMRGAEANAPAMLFFDEVDQKVKRGGAAGSGGSSVDDNMFGRLLEWMTEPTSRGRLLFVGATNEPGNIDPALKRPGRLGDGKLPLLAPDSKEERAGVLLAALRSRGVEEPPEATLLAIGARTDGWTQAELGDLARRGKVLSKVKKLGIDQALTDAASTMRPATADIKRMTIAALLECGDLSLVPDRWLPLLARAQRNEDAQATRPKGDRANGVGAARVAIADDDAWDDEEV